MAPVLETLGVLIGFVMIILLLSVYVTAAGQFTQAALRLRGRNLQRGLALFIEEVVGKPRKAAMDDAREECSGSAVVPGYASKKSVRPSRIWGPSRSWLEPDEMKGIIRGFAPALLPNADELYTRFARMTSRRFSWVMKFVSFGWAIVIAFYFQVSTPDLLNRLSANPAGTDARVATARRVLADLGGGDDRDHEGDGERGRVAYRDVAADALDELARRHPELKETLEEASGSAATAEEALEELRLALSDQTSVRESLLDEYAAILDELSIAAAASAQASAAWAREQLGRLDIRPWKGEWAFYYTEKDGVRYGTWIGVLMTAVLLTFGAPFWFQMLQNLVGLRDLLSPPKNKNGPPDSTPGGRGRGPTPGAGGGGVPGKAGEGEKDATKSEEGSPPAGSG